MQRELRFAIAFSTALLVSASTGTPPAAVAAATARAAAVAVDTAAAARLISDYRASRGLGPVKVSATLNRIAAGHSQLMAAADRLDHELPGEGGFAQRIAAGGYAAGTLTENVGAGYANLAAAIAAWKASPAHNANLLNRSVSEIGIALASTTAGAYHTYWTLILAQPATSPGKPGSGSFGPFGLFGG